MNELNEQEQNEAAALVTLIKKLGQDFFGDSLSVDQKANNATAMEIAIARQAALRGYSMVRYMQSAAEAYHIAVGMVKEKLL